MSIEIKIKKKEKNKIIYEILGEDHTLGNLLEKILIKKDGVSYASYENPHPLENKIILTIVTKDDANPEKLLKEALKEVIELSRDFRERYREALKEAGISLEE
jgi:DNA-directed RNA polymerase subunit L